MLEKKKDFTLDSLHSAAYDSYLTWFDRPLPALVKALECGLGADLARRLLG
jgi:acyl-homoserine-lactone acylase